MTTKGHRLLLGSHMSIAGGIELSIYRGAAIGCTAIQIFTKSNRQWKAKALTEEDINKFNEARDKTGITAINAHAAYIINAASTSDELYKKSTESLKIEYERAASLGLQSLVLHPGSNPDPKEGALRLARTIDEILETIALPLTKQKKQPPLLLLENMVGKGNLLGKNFEQLATIFDHIHHKKFIGYCIDTCHAFAGGYDFTKLHIYKSMMADFGSILGLERLHLIHLNDSQKPCGSQVDRHEHIGKGKIGLEGFKHIMNDEQLIDIPKILETPKDNPADDPHNMQTLKALLTHTMKSRLSIV